MFIIIIMFAGVPSVKDRHLPQRQGLEQGTKDKLYGIAQQLYQEKEGLENYLSKCTNELFNLEDKIIL